MITKAKSRLMYVTVIVSAIAFMAVTTQPAAVPTATGVRPAAATGTTPQEQVTCARPRPAGTYAAEGSLRAVRTWLRSKTMTSQSGSYRLTPGNYAIGRIAPISPDARRGSDERRLAQLAQEQCGSPMAERAWLTVVHLPRSPLSAGSLAIMTTRTPDGWRVVYDGRAGA